MKNGGKLRPHIHESGWISGAVYIHVPEKKFVRFKMSKLVRKEINKG